MQGLKFNFPKDKSNIIFRANRANKKSEPGFTNILNINSTKQGIISELNQKHWVESGFSRMWHRCTSRACLLHWFSQIKSHTKPSIQLNQINIHPTPECSPQQFFCSCLCDLSNHGWCSEGSSSSWSVLMWENWCSSWLSDMRIKNRWDAHSDFIWVMYRVEREKVRVQRLSTADKHAL